MPKHRARVLSKDLGLVSRNVHARFKPAVNPMKLCNQKYEVAMSSNNDTAEKIVKSVRFMR
jgi:hypothetical protein